MPHRERHRLEREGWLRAAVLGADDGIVSTASLLVGVAAGGATHSGLVVAGVAGLVAGAMSMAAGEYVSVSSQSDMQSAALDTERRELATQPSAELTELTHIYERRGVEPTLAAQVATQLMAHNALEAHARDELGISEMVRPQPVKAALASAGSFALGACVPVIVTWFVPQARLAPTMVAVSLGLLALLGAAAARAGGAPVARAALRVTVWGGLAMAVTYAVGALVGTAV
jgi:VIT1/CCC1 family predicted Fe2+/Mn2+ transporter